jgi:hypothetical protein
MGTRKARPEQEKQGDFWAAPFVKRCLPVLARSPPFLRTRFFAGRFFGYLEDSLTLGHYPKIKTFMRTHRPYWLMPVLLFSVISGSAQNVGIGTTSPDGSAQLDISSGGKGILIPRMTSSGIAAIPTPAKGLMVYDSTKNQLLVNMGSATAPDWENIVANSGWGLNGNIGTNSGTQFIGTTDTASLKFQVGGVLAGYLDNLGDEFNTSFGINSQQDFSSGFDNTSFGHSALSRNAGGVENTAAGTLALAANTGGSDNSAFGRGALIENVTADDNSSFGAFSLATNTTGADNTAVGFLALSENLQGNDNTAIGSLALALTTNSSFNTVVGANSATNFDNGFNNVFLGANNDVNGAGYFNVIAIGQGVVCTASSQARFGNTATNSIGGFANWTNFSDGRYKKNMKEDVVGLDFIMALRPLTYNLDVAGIQAHLNTGSRGAIRPVADARGRKIPSTTDRRAAIDPHMQQAMAQRESEVLSGFSAQEVEKAAQAAGYAFSGVDKPKNDNDFYGLRYGDFVVPLVKAVQEQQQMIRDLQKKFDQQAAQLEQQAELIKQLLPKK